MITELRLRLFKCFESLNLPIRPLTLLTGLNASGKSTISQALWLLTHSATSAPNEGVLRLDDPPGPSLGSVADVVDELHGRQQFSLGLGGANFDIEWNFSAEDRGSSTMKVETARWGQKLMHGVPLRRLVPASETTQAAEALRNLFARTEVVGAERLGPRETYRLAHEQWHDRVGPRGERMGGALWWFGDEGIPEELCRGGYAPSLRAQASAWLNEFFPGISLQVERIPNASSVTLSFRTSNETKFHRPQHVGYGITHALPIIIAALRSKGRLLLVENPEAHLHPAGQAAMGAFLARAASSGATVILETHSDHVLSGVRRAVRDQLIHPELVGVNFFRERSLAQGLGVSQVVSPQINSKGDIDEWPAGFFDQFDLDMSYLAGLGGV